MSRGSSPPAGLAAIHTPALEFRLIAASTRGSQTNMPKQPLDTFSPISAPRAFEHVCDQIRMHLASGALKPGDRLPPERDLATHLRVSRSVLREALRSLEIAGLLDLKKGGAGGSFIAGHNWRFVTQAYSDMVRVGTITLGELIEARTLITVNAIQLGCERATVEDYAALEENIALTEQYTRDNDYARRRLAATDFYRLLAVAARNQVLLMSTEAMSATMLEFLKAPRSRKLVTLVESRHRFMQHFRRRDAEKASSEMVTYLAGVNQYLLIEADVGRPSPGNRRSAASKSLVPPR